MHRPENVPEYLLTFSSFYQAMYAKDKLMEQGIAANVRRVPAQLLRSCGQALYVSGYELRRLIEILSESQIDAKGVFHVEYVNGKPEYRQLR